MSILPTEKDIREGLERQARIQNTRIEILESTISTCKGKLKAALFLLKELERMDGRCPICRVVQRYAGEINHLPTCALGQALKGVE